jgi:hypothetical protein
MILDALPDELIAGDTWRWTRDLGDYPSASWTVTTYFENATNSFSATGSPSGTAHAFTVASATTAVLLPGRYRWTVRAVGGGISETVESGWLTIQVDPAAAGNADPRGYARQLLDALEATLLGRATSDQLSMAINGRSLSRIPLNELRDWRTQLKQEVKSNENTAQNGKGRDIKLRLVRV